MFPQSYFTKGYFPGAYWEPAGEYVQPTHRTMRVFYRGTPKNPSAVIVSKRYYYIDEEVGEERWRH